MPVAIRLMVLASLLVTILVPGARPVDAQPPMHEGDGTFICDDGSFAYAQRCVTFDGLATRCSADEVCLTQIDNQPDEICFSPTVTRPDGTCETSRVAASEHPASCPEATRGEAGACHVFVAKILDGDGLSVGCPVTSNENADGNCAQPVADAATTYFCPEDLDLDGTECIATEPPLLDLCPAGSTRVMAVCFVDNLTLPTGCFSRPVAANGQCEFNSLIPLHSDACDPGTTYLSSHSACVLAGGVVVIACHYPDSEHTLIETATGCREVALLADATCEADFSIDDSLGSRCARVEPLVEAACPAGTEAHPILADHCAVVSDFATGTCPAGLTQLVDEPALCVNDLPGNERIECGEIALAGAGAVNCYFRAGPQPGECPDRDDGDRCYYVDGPLGYCLADTSPCVHIDRGFTAVSPERRGDVDCSGALDNSDSTELLRYILGEVGLTVGPCELLAEDYLLAGATDLSLDSYVTLVDAMVLSQCVAGASNFTCPPS